MVNEKYTFQKKRILSLQPVSDLIDRTDMLFPGKLFLQALYMQVHGPAVSGVFLFPNLLIDDFPVQSDIGISGKKEEKFIFLQRQQDLLSILKYDP